jgi:tetrahydromethanopterin S-methyltransferase subunit A
MSKTKKIFVVISSVLGLLFLLAVWYKYSYAMDKAEAFEVNSIEYQQKLLIATQGSEFKDKITLNVVNHFKEDSIFINVIDISDLKEIKPADYNAFLLIHTWENWKPPIEVDVFINRTKDYKDRIVVITTSGKGVYKMLDVDAIAGESKTENILPFTREAIYKIESILN